MDVDTHATPQPVDDSKRALLSRLLGREEYFIIVDEWGNKKEKKKLRSKDGGDQMCKFLPSCEIRDLKTDAKHNIRTTD
jgi:hypothetical protein